MSKLDSSEGIFGLSTFLGIWIVICYLGDKANSSKIDAS